MAARLTLFVDWYNKKLVKGLEDPGVFTLPARTQGENLPMQIYLVKPSGIYYAQENIASMSMKLAVANAPEATPFVTAYSWSKDTSDGNGYFYTDVDFNTGALDTWMDGSATKNAYMEMEITEDNSVSTIYTTSSLTINAFTVPAGTTTVAPGQTALSLEVGNQIYVSKKMGNGESIMIPSPNGNWGTVLRTNNDGSFETTKIALT
jgi:hypothetical protein